MKKIVLSLITILAITIGILPFLTKEPITANAEETEITLIREDGWIYAVDYNGVNLYSDIIFRLYKERFGEMYYYKGSGEVSNFMESSTNIGIFGATIANGIVTQTGLHFAVSQDTFSAGTKFYIRNAAPEGVSNLVTYRFLTAENEIINLNFKGENGRSLINFGDNSFKVLGSIEVVNSSGVYGGAYWTLESAKSLKLLSVTSTLAQNPANGYAVMSSYEEVGNVAPALRTFKDFEDGFLEKANKWVNNAFNVNLTGPVFGTLFIGLIVLLVVRRGRR